MLLYIGIEKAQGSIIPALVGVAIAVYAALAAWLKARCLQKIPSKQNAYQRPPQ